jgi:ATP dependent DNA ligase domain
MVTRRIRTDGFVDPCIPTLAAKPPSGPGWVHEIKHDGYRLIVRRDGKAVRLFTRRGYDWSDRYPAIAAAAAKLRAKSFTLDGEAVVGPKHVLDRDAQRASEIGADPVARGRAVAGDGPMNVGPCYGENLRSVPLMRRVARVP